MPYQRKRPPAIPPIPVAPLAVKPQVACRLLDVGMSKLYDLMRIGELPNFHLGPGASGRRLPLQGIENYIARRLAETNPTPGKRQSLTRASAEAENA